MRGSFNRIPRRENIQPHALSAVNHVNLNGNPVSDIGYMDEQIKRYHYLTQMLSKMFSYCLEASYIITPKTAYLDKMRASAPAKKPFDSHQRLGAWDCRTRDDDDRINLIPGRVEVGNQ